MDRRNEYDSKKAQIASKEKNAFRMGMAAFPAVLAVSVVLFIILILLWYFKPEISVPVKIAIGVGAIVLLGLPLILIPASYRKTKSISREKSELSKMSK